MFKSNLYFYFSCLLFFLVFLVTKLISINSLYIGGHDTFQYIHWADVLFSEERNLIFFRPALYLITFLFHNMLEWSPFAFKIMLLTFSMGSFLILCAILKSLKSSHLANVLILITFIFSTSFIVADAVGHITAIENFFILALVYFSLRLNKSKTFVNYSLFFITGLISTLIHEEKILYALLLVFIVEGSIAKSLKLTLLLIFSIFIIYLIIGGQNINENSALIAGSVALSWGNHFYFLTNVVDTFQSAMDQFGFIQSILCFSLLMYILMIWVSKTYNIVLNQYKARNTFTNNILSFFSILFLENKFSKELNILFIPSILYFIIIGVAFAGLDLPRTTSPIMFPLLIGAIVLISESIFVNRYKVVFVLLFMFSALLNVNKSLIDINKHDNEEVKYSKIYLLLNDYGFECSPQRKIGIDKSFENRPPMWGGDDNKYGLGSKVYFGNCAEKINSTNIDKNFGVIIYYNNANDSIKYPTYLLNESWKMINFENYIIFLKNS